MRSLRIAAPAISAEPARIVSVIATSPPAPVFGTFGMFVSSPMTRGGVCGRV